MVLGMGAFARLHVRAHRWLMKARAVLTDRHRRNAPQVWVGARSTIACLHWLHKACAIRLVL